MLTNIYYYDFYKPYLLSTQTADTQTPAPRRKKVAEKAPVSTQDYKVLLNKSMKTDVVSYARNVSDSVVGAKNVSKNLVRDMEDFNKNTYKHGYSTAKGWISDDLDAFAKQYNDSVKFLSSQQHSPALRKFAGNIKAKVTDGVGELQPLGVSMDETGALSFDKEKFGNLNEAQIHQGIGQSINLFSNLYNDSANVLSEPLTEHMKFKGLGYYYNYKLGAMESDTFKIIESGMLVDKAV